MKSIIHARRRQSSSSALSAILAVVAAGATLFALPSTSQAQVIYVDDGTGDIYSVNPSGAVSTFATLPGSSPGSEGMAVDSDGNLYVADFRNNQIDRITPGGSTSVFADLTTAGFPAASPTGLVFLGSNLYVAGNGDNQLLKITPGGSVSSFATLPGSGPFSLAVDSTGNFYTADSTDNHITKISADGSTVSMFATVGGGVYGLALDGAGNVYAAADLGGAIDVFDPTGLSLGNFGSNYPHNFFPEGLTFDNTGNLDVADGGNGNLLQFNSTGTSQSVFAPTSGSFIGGVNFVAFSPTPEPGSAALMALGAAAVLGWRRRSFRA